MGISTKRNLIITAVIIAALGVAFITVRGCTLMPWAKNKQGASVSVDITRDYGRTVVRSADAQTKKGDSVMDVLKSVADVETEYGGGFVSSIEGLKSSPGTGGGNDWFYYVNGVLAGVGSVEYVVAEGDNLWWDYHPWNSDNFIPAVVGSYPSPFDNGYSGSGGATILYGDELDSTAKEIGGYLEGRGARVVYSPLEQQAADARTPVMVICSITEASGTEWIRGLIDESGLAGALLKPADGRLVPIDGEGNPASLEEDLVAGIVATGTGIGDRTPVWLVLVAGKPGAAQAVRLLSAEPDALRLKTGVAVGSSGSVYQLPVEVPQ